MPHSVSSELDARRTVGTAGAPGETESHTRRARLTFLVVFVAGVLLNSADAFHNQLWFDESFSTALAQHSFADIWRIGSLDVHPVLYYWVLHVVYLAFGNSLVAYRLFSMACTAALALLGWTHVRRDTNDGVGIMFSAFVLFSPWSLAESEDIRMYAWAALLVGITLIYTRRLAAAALANSPVPTRWWAFAFTAALASAYSHYYAAIAAFCCMVVLLVASIHAARSGRRKPLRCFVIGALACLAAFAPWICTVATQVSAVSSSYWIPFVFPDTVFDYLAYPLRADMLISLGLDGNYGLFWKLLTQALRYAFLLVLALSELTLIRSMRMARRGSHASGPAASRRLERLARALATPLGSAATVYFGTILLAMAASLTMRQSIMLQRYLHCAAAAMALLFAMLLSRFDRRRLVAMGVLCFMLLGCVDRYWSFQVGYSPENAEAVDYYRQATHAADGETIPVCSAGDVGDNFQAIGPLSQLVPDARISTTDEVPAYEAFSPVVALVHDPSEGLADYHGDFVYVSVGDKGYMGMRDFAGRCGATVVSTRQFRRPYHDNTWTISVLSK